MSGSVAGISSVGTIQVSLQLSQSGTLFGGSWCPKSEEGVSFQGIWNQSPHYSHSQDVMVIGLQIPALCEMSHLCQSIKFFLGNFNSKNFYFSTLKLPTRCIPKTEIFRIMLMLPSLSFSNSSKRWADSCPQFLLPAGL